jgi:hypothetical protein
MFSRRKSTAAGGVMKLSLVITWDNNKETYLQQMA